MKVQNVLSEIVHWRLNTSVYDMWTAVQFAEYAIGVELSERHCLTARSCVCWMNELAKVDQRFPIYFSAVELLQIVHKISRNGFSDDLFDILAIILQSNVNNDCFTFRVLSQNETEMNTSELVGLLLKHAVEHLTTYRQLIAPDLCSVATIVTTDFEALYAYKRGDYQRCLQLSTQNVHTLLYARHLHNVPMLPQFIQLLDDDIVSLIALTLITNPECRHHTDGYSISQLTLLLYLMTQCQLKLHHLVTTLAQTFHYIKVVHGKHSSQRPMKHLTLKLIERKVHRTISNRN